jgi:hypothetical protein
MALTGNAAMLLSFDVAPEATVEHDDWHTHEHMPERLSIPGFMRGSRWVALSGAPRYFVMYEVSEFGVLDSEAYLERLNNPTPWTTKMMVHYRGMTRGLCRVAESFGLGIGQAALLLHFTPAPGERALVDQWLTRQLLPDLVSRPGLASAHLFESALTPRMTGEQSIRGKDAGVDWALLVTGYRPETVGSISEHELSGKRFAEHHAAHGRVRGVYRMEYSLTERELHRPR